MVVKREECGVCGCKQIKNYPAYKEQNLIKCADCGFVFSSLTPSEEELDNHYRENYDLTQYFSPITKIRYNKILDDLEKYRNTNRILDVGCGCGFFLETARERGWEVYGVEKTEEISNDLTASGVKMYCGDFRDCQFEENSFDVIISIEVIEHVLQPNLFVKKGYDLLRPGGLFYLTTPNFNSYLRYRLKNKFDVIDYPSHLQYFTNKTLKHLFALNNFQKVDLISTGISLTRYRTSMKLSNQEYVAETSDDEMLRYRIEKSPFLKNTKWIADRFLNLFKLGITLKGSFVKS